jgi:hypothetical protein
VPFRLIFKGHLPSGSSADSRKKEKHAIRKEFHRQLVELWERNPSLRRRKGIYTAVGRTLIDETADNYARCGFRFVPLISRGNGLGCSLDILFLRRDEPGKVVSGGGDIDNRLKVLFDGLKMPTECNQVSGFAPEPGEDPFFCLMEDDSLITEVKITTDRLLLPKASDEGKNDVMLIIHATAVILDAVHAPPGFYP